MVRPTGDGLRQRLMRRIEECRSADEAQPGSEAEERRTAGASSSREDTPLVARETPRGAFEFVGAVRDSDADTNWIGEAQKSLVEKAPPPLDVCAATVGAEEISSMDLTSWDKAHLVAYTEPQNRVFPIFFYDGPKASSVDRVELEEQVSRMIAERRAKMADLPVRITPKMIEDAGLAHQRVRASGSLGLSDDGSSTLHGHDREDSDARTSPSTAAPRSAFAVSVKSLAYKPNPKAVAKKVATGRKRKLARQARARTQEAGWNRPEFVMTPSTTYKTGNVEVWQRVRNLKEDKRLRVPFERSAVEIHHQKTIVEQEAEQKLHKKNSTAYLPNGLPKSNALDPNRMFQRISTQYSEETEGKFSEGKSVNYENDAFSGALSHELKLVQLIDRREQAVKALRKLVKAARSGKSIQTRKSARKQLVTRRLGAKLDVIRMCSVDIALAIDRWRIAVESSEDVKGTKPYGIDADSTTMFVAGESFFGLTPPPRPFLWRGINYVIKMSHDLRFLDTDSKTWGGRLLTKVGLLSTEINPLLLPVTLKECSARAPVSVVERSALPLRVRTFRGIETSRIRAAATIIEDEVKHMHETATRLSAALKHAARMQYEEQTQARMHLRRQAQHLLDNERDRILEHEAHGKEELKKERYLAHETSVNTIAERMQETSNRERRAMMTSKLPTTPDLIKRISYNADTGFYSTDGSSVIFTEESSTIVAEAIVTHALAVATDLDAKASLTLPSKPSTAEQLELRESEPTIKSLATEFAQRLLDRSRSEDGLGTASFEELIGMRRSGFRPRVPNHGVIKNSIGDRNSWESALDFATELEYQKTNEDLGAVRSEPSRTPRTAQHMAYCEMVQRIAVSRQNEQAIKVTERDKTEVAASGIDTRDSPLVSKHALPQKSLSAVEDSALMLATLLDSRSCGADQLRSSNSSILAHTMAMAPSQGRNDNPVVQDALAYASQLLKLAQGNETEQESEDQIPGSKVDQNHYDTANTKEKYAPVQETKDQQHQEEKGRKAGAENGVCRLSNILVHAIIDGRPHDVSVVTNYSDDSVQVVCIDDIGIVSRLRLHLSNVQDASPRVFDLSRVEHANELVRWLDYRWMETGDARTRIRSLVYVPVFEPIPGSPSSSRLIRMQRASHDASNDRTLAVGASGTREIMRKGIELVGNTEDSHVYPSYRGAKRITPINELEIEYNLPAPYTICVNSVVKIQAMARGLKAKRTAEFKRKVREQKLVRREGR